jgi:hypothetical protein
MGIDCVFFRLTVLFVIASLAMRLPLALSHEKIRQFLFHCINWTVCQLRRFGQVKRFIADLHQPDSVKQRSF